MQLHELACSSKFPELIWSFLNLHAVAWTCMQFHELVCHSFLAWSFMSLYSIPQLSALCPNICVCPWTKMQNVSRMHADPWACRPCLSIWHFKQNKHFKSSQKLLNSSFVNERFKKYSMLLKELLTFKTTNFTKTWNITEICACVHMCCKLVLSSPIL